MHLYAIADLHLSLSGDKPMDVFGGWENYMERLEENWRRLVTPEDTVVIAGDISWGISLADAEEDFRWLDALPGQKILMKGNHDYWFSTKTKVERFFAERGFASLSVLFNNAFRCQDYAICGTRGWINEPGAAADKKVLDREAGRLRLSLEAAGRLGGKPLVFLHYPPVFQQESCAEILSVLREFSITEVYYGHLHGQSCRYAEKGVRDGIAYHLISGDFLEFCPTVIF